jgi:hypothetical protein
VEDQEGRRMLRNWAGMLKVCSIAHLLSRKNPKKISKDNNLGKKPLDLYRYHK